MNIGHLRPGTAKNLDVQRTEQPVDRETAALPNVNTDSENGEDRITISKEARALLKADRALRDELEKLPGLRKEKIDMAMARIHSGFYSREEVLEKVAEQLLSG